MLYGEVMALEDERPLSRALPLRQGPWFVLTTHAGQERRARYELSRQGFPVYLPLRAAEGRERLRHHDFPLFPGYIFARALPDGRWHSMLFTIGVRRVLMNGEAPATMAEELIAETQAREAREIERVRQRLDKEDAGVLDCLFAPGDEVEFDYLGRVVRAIFAARETNTRVALMMGMVGRTVKVDLRQLRAAE